MKTREDYWREWVSFAQDVSSEEETLDRLRVFVHQNKALLTEEDLKGVRNLPETFEALTDLAETALKAGVDWELQNLREEGAVSRGDFCVVAMGKFGGRELNYQSDLDLIYLYERPEDQEFYSRLGAKIIRALTLFTKSGYAYHIDTALRPSGGSGTLVSSLNSFLDYHRTVGRTWERQALIKARPVVSCSGEKTFTVSAFAEKLKTVFSGISYRDIDASAVASEIDHLRERMEKEIAREKPGRYNLKTGYGGLVDIEFLTQFLQLRHGKNHPSLQTPNTLEALRALARENILSEPLAEELKASYLFLRRLQTRLRQELQQPTDEFYAGSAVAKKVEEVYFPGEAVLPRFLEIRENVRRLYTLYLRDFAKG